MFAKEGRSESVWIRGNNQEGSEMERERGASRLTIVTKIPRAKMVRHSIGLQIPTVVSPSKQ